MRAIFGRKISNLTELKEITEQAKKNGDQGQRYIVTKEVFLEFNEFQRFANDFFNDQYWITKEDGGMTKEREVCCIRVISDETDEKILINNEGYFYARYVAIEKD